MTKEQVEKLKIEIKKLEVKKLFKINENGNKVKVRRDAENKYSIYHNGHFVTTDATWDDTAAFLITLINS